MRLTCINVGYGDAFLLKNENGFITLLDGGSALVEEFDGDEFRIRAADFIKAQNIRYLDAVLISHIHEDHVCGLERILHEVEVGALYVPYPVKPFQEGREIAIPEDAPRNVQLYTSALNAYCRILAYALEKGIPVHTIQTGERLTLTNGLEMQVLAPRKKELDRYLECIAQLYSKPNAFKELLTELDALSNQASLLLRFSTPRGDFLAAADSCPALWTEVPNHLLENVTVLKLPHHGQKDSICEQIMRKMPLQYVITTASSDRRYNSANPEVYERLTEWRSPNPPRFLFTDERRYPPYFSQPEGFQAIELEINSEGIHPGFINIRKKEI